MWTSKLSILITVELMLGESNFSKFSLNLGHKSHFLQGSRSSAWDAAPKPPGRDPLNQLNEISIVIKDWKLLIPVGMPC